MGYIKPHQPVFGLLRKLSEAQMRVKHARRGEVGGGSRSGELEHVRLLHGRVVARLSRQQHARHFPHPVRSWRI